MFVVTGGAQGLGLALAEALVEAGGIVYCLDRRDKPNQSFYTTKEKLAQQFGGTLHYRQVNVQEAENLNNVISAIADEHKRMDGLIAAAGIQHVQPALEYDPAEVPTVSLTGCFCVAIFEDYPRLTTVIDVQH